MASKIKPAKIDFKALTSEEKIHQIFENLNKFVDPEEYLNKHGSKTKLRRLMYDDAIHGAFETRFDQILGLKHSLVGDDDEVVNFIKQAIGEKCLVEIIKGAMNALPFGYNVTELIYSQQENAITIDKAINKPFEHYKVDKYGNLYINKNLTSNEPVPYAKYILTRHRASYSHPYGQSLLSRLYFAFDFRCHGWDFYVKFLEKFGHPLLFAQVDAKPADPITGRSNMDDIAKHLHQANRPTAIVMDRESDLKVFNPANSGAQFKDFINAVNKRIQIVILGQTLTTDTQGVGSQALGNVHNLVREDKKKQDMRMVEDSVNQVIEYIGVLNEIDKERLPKFSLEDTKKLKADRAQRDTLLANLGVKFTERYIQEHYDLTEEDFEIVDRQLGVDLGFGDTSSPKFQKFMASKKQLAKQNKNLDDIIDDAADKATFALDFDELGAIIENSSGPKDLENKLSEIISRDDEKYLDTLTNLLFASRVQGFLDAEENK